MQSMPNFASTVMIYTQLVAFLENSTHDCDWLIKPIVEFLLVGLVESLPATLDFICLLACADL